MYFVQYTFLIEEKLVILHLNNITYDKEITLRGTPGKRVIGETDSGVRIPLFPQKVLRPPDEEPFLFILLRRVAFDDRVQSRALAEGDLLPYIIYNV